MLLHEVSFPELEKVAWLGAALSSQNPPCGCFSSVVEPAVAAGGPLLCPLFSGVPAPCPSALLKCPVPGGSLEGVDRLPRGSCAPSRQPSGLSGLTGQGPVSPLFGFRLPVTSSVFLHGGTHTAQVSWVRPHLPGVTGALSGKHSAHHFLFCSRVGCLLQVQTERFKSYPVTQPGLADSLSKLGKMK